jgi:hypothetical protein
MEVLKNTTILAFMPPNSRYQTLSRFSFNGYASWATGIVELAAGLIGFAAKHVSAEPPAIVYVLDTVCRVCHTLKEPVCHIAARALDLVTITVRLRVLRALRIPQANYMSWIFTCCFHIRLVVAWTVSRYTHVSGIIAADTYRAC